MAVVYRHIRLDTNEVFYIGIGITEKRPYLKTGRSNWWKKIVLKTDYEVEIFFEHEDYEVIKQKEIEFIKLYGRRDLGLGTLVNMTDGGEGQLNPSIETRKKMRERFSGEANPNYGKKPTEKTRLLMSNAKKGEKNKLFGKPLPEEHRKKIGQSNKGKKRTDEMNKVNSELRKGSLHPNFGKNRSQETKDKIGNANRGENSACFGKRLTEEQKQKKRGVNNVNSKKVIDTQLNKIYACLREASEAIGMDAGTLSKRLNGKMLNNTNLKFL